MNERQMMNERSPTLGYYFVRREKGEKGTSEAQEKDNFLWSTANTNLLIATYRNAKHEFDDPKIKKKVAWSNVAALMQVSECNVTSQQCQNKWMYLLEKYKRTKDHNDKSGNDRVDFEFFDKMEEILAKQPEFRSLALASSISGYKRSVSCNEVEDDAINDASDGDDGVIEYFPKKAKVVSKSDKIKIPEHKNVSQNTKSAEKQQVLLQNSVNDRKKKRKERPRDKLVQFFSTMHEDRQKQADKDFEQRERFIAILMEK